MGVGEFPETQQGIWGFDFVVVFLCKLVLLEIKNNAYINHNLSKEKGDPKIN